MAAPGTLALLTLLAGVCSGRASQCSYFRILSRLQLDTNNNGLQVMRPVKNWTTATFVQIDMLLYGILEMDEKSQTVTNHAWISMQWTNEFLTWNSSDYCGINMLTIPRTMLWIPDIGIQEDVSDTGSIQDGPLVALYANGTMITIRRQRLTFTCQFDLRMFPFDQQRCNITFASMSSNADAIILGTIFSDTNLSSMSERIMITQGEWAIKTLKTQECKVNATAQCQLIYKVLFERKPMLYVINFIVPLFYLLFLDLTSFFISEARGEKLSFKVTILLSISVLLLLLQDMLPSTEDNLPLIATYCIAIFVLVGISVLEAMLVTFLVDLDDYCGMKAQTPAEATADIPLEAVYPKEFGPEDKDQVKPDKIFTPLDPPSHRELLNLILDEVKAAQQEAGKKHVVKRKYKKMAEIVDHVFFFFYFATVTVFLSYMYAVWMRNLG